MSAVMHDKATAGRPREERADRAIVAATLELIAEHGIADLRMDDVAGRAGVGKATIYRRYRSKRELVTTAVTALVNEIEAPDTGSTRGDLLGLMRSAANVYSGSVESRVMPSLVAAMARDPELAQAVRTGLVVQRRAAFRDVLARGVERGDLRAGLDLDVALDLLGGPIFYRLLMTGAPIDRRLADDVVELALGGIAAPPSRDQTLTTRGATR